MKKPVILIAGGDMRQLYCAAKLSDEFEVAVLGFDKDTIPDDLSLELIDSTANSSYDCAILPVPPLTDENALFTPCSSEKITAETLKKLLKPDATVFAGKVDKTLRCILSEHEVIDYLLSEELNLKNAVPTAEGAVQLALEEMPETLNGTDVLIVGMGRIGTALAQILKGFGANVTAAVHNQRGAAKARLQGINSIPTRRLNGNYSLVFNTVPKMIFDRKMLEKFNDQTLFIDLASKPGGIDFDAAVEHGIKAIWALGLPGKTAPVTSGEIIAETVQSILTERGEGFE